MLSNKVLSYACLIDGEFRFTGHFSPRETPEAPRRKVQRRPIHQRDADSEILVIGPAQSLGEGKRDLDSTEAKVVPDPEEGEVLQGRLSRLDLTLAPLYGAGEGSAKGAGHLLNNDTEKGGSIYNVDLQNGKFKRPCSSL